MKSVVKEEIKPYLPGTKVLDRSVIANWLWEAAGKIRGPADAPKYKDYILPLIFLKRVSDVFDDEVVRVAKEIGCSPKEALAFIEEDHSLVRFFLPEVSRWDHLIKIRAGLGQKLTDGMRAFVKQNRQLSGVLDTMDFNATTAGQRIISDDALANLMQELNKHRLGLYDVQPDIIGDAYEYLLRKFAEGGGQSAGEFYTPREVARLMARLLAPEPGMTIYDPCCGSAGLLIKCHLRLLETHGVQENGSVKLPNTYAPLKLFGQEMLPATYAMAKMNAFIHQMECEIHLGDTMKYPKTINPDGSLRKFDRVTANPMWNQDAFNQSDYENDTYNRFLYGIPPNSSADWGWVQHMLASLNENGRMAVVLDTGAVSRGSGNTGSNRERDIRKKITEAGLIEAVLLPENIFYNTSAPGIIMILNRAKRRQGEILLINGSAEFVKGRPKNELTDENIARIAEVFEAWEDRPGLSRVITLEEAARNDYNLSPSRYVSNGKAEEVLPLEEAVVLLKEAEEEREQADKSLAEVLNRLGL